LLAAHNTSWKA